MGYRFSGSFRDPPTLPSSGGGYSGSGSYSYGNFTDNYNDSRSFTDSWNRDNYSRGGRWPNKGKSRPPGIPWGGNPMSYGLGHLPGAFGAFAQMAQIDPETSRRNAEELNKWMSDYLPDWYYKKGWWNWAGWMTLNKPNSSSWTIPAPWCGPVGFNPVNCLNPVYTAWGFLTQSGTVPNCTTRVESCGASSLPNAMPINPALFSMSTFQLNVLNVGKAGTIQRYITFQAPPQPGGGHPAAVPSYGPAKVTVPNFVGSPEPSAPDPFPRRQPGDDPAPNANKQVFRRHLPQGWPDVPDRPGGTSGGGGTSGEWPPLPDPEPDPDPGHDPGHPPYIVPGSGTTWTPGDGDRPPPFKDGYHGLWHDKAHKLWVSRALYKIIRGYHTATEVKDFFEALAGAIPGDPCGRKPGFAMAACVLQHWDEIDVKKAVKNIVVNEIEDQIVGRSIGQLGKLTEAGGPLTYQMTAYTRPLSNAGNYARKRMR